MVIYFAMIVLASTVLSGPAWWAAKRRNAWFGWDYATLIAPFTLWVLLISVVDFGAQSLGNLAEIFILLVFIPMALSIRVFALDRWSNPRANSIAIFVISTLCAFALRAFMPLLPE